jgi:hypothetical protein
MQKEIESECMIVKRQTLNIIRYTVNVYTGNKTKTKLSYLLAGMKKCLRNSTLKTNAVKCLLTMKIIAR